MLSSFRAAHGQKLLLVTENEQGPIPEATVFIWERTSKLWLGPASYGWRRDRQIHLGLGVVTVTVGPKIRLLKDHVIRSLGHVQ